MIIRFKKFQGFSLLEVLISMFILSIGLLGLMSLQLIALQTNSNSNFRTLATIAAYDMSDRIRANNIGFQAGDYNSISAGAKTCSGCNATSVTDILQWQTSLENLPEGKGAISLAKPAADGLDITVSWKENVKGSSKPVEKTFILRARFQ